MGKNAEVRNYMVTGILIRAGIMLFIAGLFTALFMLGIISITTLGILLLLVIVINIVLTGLFVFITPKRFTPEVWREVMIKKEEEETEETEDV
jgi:hypothetical protein